MTPEQLRAARREYWRQDGNPVLTSGDARAWFERHPLSLFQPRQAQLPAPAPSFVEAVEGRSNTMPSLSAVENAGEILTGLLNDATVIALNLLGGVGEQPDFLAQTEILPFLIALRGDRDWKQPPASAGGRHVSPLMLELWALLEQDGPSTVAAAREKLGRELTESAVLRALGELWQRLRAIPVLQAGGRPAVWELVKQRHSRALATGSGTSQVTAISLLVSTYLQSVYAASGEEIEVFLSPLVSRSRIREAVRGLSATRQIRELSMETQTYYFLEGGLPEFAPVVEPEVAEAGMAAAVGDSATVAAPGQESRQRARRPAPLPPVATRSRTSFRPAPGRGPASKQGMGQRMGQQRSSRAPGRSQDRSPVRFQDRSGDRFRDRPGDRQGDRSRGGFSGQFRDRGKDRAKDSMESRGGDRSSDRVKPGKYRPPIAPSKTRWTRAEDGETTGAPVRRPPKEGWDSPRAVSNRRPPGEGKWRRFSDPSEQDRPRYQGARDRTRRGDARQGDVRNNQRNEGKARESGKPLTYGGGRGRPFRPRKPQGREDRPKSSGGFGGDAGFARGSRREFHPKSRPSATRGPNRRDRETRNHETRDQDLRSQEARRHGTPSRDARRGSRAPGGFAPSNPNRDSKIPQDRGPREGYSARPKWQKAGAKPGFGPGREAGSRENGPSGSTAPGVGKFAPKGFGSGKFRFRPSGSRPPNARSRSEGQARQPGFRGKKTQASFRGKRWPKKKPEA